MQFSIIIPSYNSGSYIARCLNSVLAELKVLPQASYEIIVVDSSASDLSEKLKTEFSNIKFLHSTERLYAGAARNKGAAQAKYPVLCFLDSDCCWNSGWLNAAQETAKKFPDWLALNGAIFFENPSNKLPFALHLFEFHEFTSQRNLHQRFIHSGNLLIKRDFFNRLGGFREDVPMCTDFTFAALSKTDDFSKIYYLPKMSITHLEHLVDPNKLKKKVEEMGYWRGYVDSELPQDLQITSKLSYQLIKHNLGLVFFLLIVFRSFKLRSFYSEDILKQSFNLLSFCKIWAKGFENGILNSENRTKDSRRSL